MTHDQLLRLVLGGEAFVGLILGGALLGSLWARRGWPLRTVTFGGLMVLIYVLAGQVKAFLLDIPFDWFAWLGVVAYAVLIVGCVWSIRAARRDG